MAGSLPGSRHRGARQAELERLHSNLALGVQISGCLQTNELDHSRRRLTGHFHRGYIGQATFRSLSGFEQNRVTGNFLFALLCLAKHFNDILGSRTRLLPGDIL